MVFLRALVTAGAVHRMNELLKMLCFFLYLILDPLFEILDKDWLLRYCTVSRCFK